MKIATLILAAGCVSLLVGCQSVDAIEALDTLRQAGKITEEQYQSAREVVNSGGSWGTIALEIGRTALDVLITLGIIRGWRGGVNARKGQLFSPSAQS